MKKALKFYALVWLVLLILFNVISFAVPGWGGAEKYSPSFWLGYAFISAALVGQIVCAYFALKEDNANKTFYNISLIAQSYTGLILTFVFGGLCMVAPVLPYWVSIVLCAIVLAVNVIIGVKACAAVELVSGIDEKVTINTSFTRSLTAEAEGLMSRAQNAVIKAECKKVHEAIRYSDPVSNSASAPIENEIAIKFSKLSDAACADDEQTVKETAEALLALLGDRNKKCRLSK